VNVVPSEKTRGIEYEQTIEVCVCMYVCMYMNGMCMYVCICECRS
jgi:hypothetical protein